MRPKLPFTAYLAQEHVFISEMLGLFRGLALDLANSPGRRSKELLELIPLLQEVLSDVHHHKEEEILFPIIDESTPVHQGGPQCALFMTHLLVEDLGRDLRAEAKKDQLSQPPLSSFISELSEKNSPLMIPVQEHWAGQFAFRMLEKLLRQIQSGDHSPLTDCFLLASRFDRMMQLHIEKEDTCLFVLADQFIPEDFQTELLALADHQRPNDRERLLEIRVAFERLAQASGQKALA